MLNCTASDGKLGEGLGTRLVLKLMCSQKKNDFINLFVLDLATWNNALECKYNVCEASVHIAQTSVSTAV